MPRPAPVHKVCATCSSEFTVPKTRELTAKFCSRKCSDVAPRKHHTVLCRECGIEFARKKSQAEKAKIYGNFCGMACLSKARSRINLGDKNPNSSGRNTNYHGYRIYTPQASLGFGLGRMKLHHAVAFTALGLKKLPKGLHVHHRDCNVLNNDPCNLQLMLASDHKWLHHQYGTVTLKAIMENKISIEDAASWSDDPIRANILLSSNVNTQSQIHAYLMEKFGKSDPVFIAALKPVTGVEFELVDEFYD